MTKNKEQPHALSCGAKTRKGTLCKTPAVKGKKRCRMHGGAKGSGAPKGNCNALKHGFYTEQARHKRHFLQKLIKQTRELIDRC